MKHLKNTCRRLLEAMDRLHPEHPEKSPSQLAELAASLCDKDE